MRGLLSRPCLGAFRSIRKRLESLLLSMSSTNPAAGSNLFLVVCGYCTVFILTLTIYYFLVVVGAVRSETSTEEWSASLCSTRDSSNSETVDSEESSFSAMSLLLCLSFSLVLRGAALVGTIALRKRSCCKRWTTSISFAKLSRARLNILSLRCGRRQQRKRQQCGSVS